MKQKISRLKSLIVLLQLLIVCALPSAAASFSISSLTLNSGAEGAMNVTLSNSGVTVVSFQFDLTMPEGITLVESAEGGFDITPATRLSKHTVVANRLDGGNTYRVLVYSPNNDNITGTSGNVLTFKIKADVAPGSYDIEGSNALLTNNKMAEVQVADFSRAITVKNVAVTGLSLDKTSLQLKVGETEKLTATVKPENATDKTVTWTSTNPSVASVDSEGNVTGVKAGTADIMARCGIYTATCKVTVATPDTESVELDLTELTMQIGDSKTLTATVKPDEVADKTVTWTSSNSTIATVDSSGRVIALSVGTAVITAANGGKSATCLVTVTPVPVQSISLNKNVLNLTEGQSEALVATIYPSNATDRSLTWTSSNNSVATVNNGVVTAIKTGTATITVSQGDKRATCELTVSPVPSAGVILNKSAIELVIGQTEKLQATVKPDNVTDKSISWSSSNTAVATVDSNGVVTAVNVGTAVITAANGGKTATCEVTVLPIQVESITLNVSQMELLPGQTGTLVATILPANATDKSITWSSSNNAVAKVDSNGVVTAIKEGVATITALCGSKSATCIVKVNPTPTESVTLNLNSITLHAGETQQLTATVKPDNVTDKSISWSSSNTAVATVDSNGVVTAVNVGTAVITAANGGKTATCEVTVLPIQVESISLNVSQMELFPGQTGTLVATILPENATDKSIKWSSSNNAVATVDSNGVVTAINEGMATITALCGSKSATCTVKVNPTLTESVTLNLNSITLRAGETQQLTATVKPDNVIDKTINWSSSNTAVAIVDAYGVVTAVNVGTAVITAANGGKTATCVVEVVATPAESISISYESIELIVDQTQQLSATVLPANATDRSVKWQSSNNAVATVDETGLVTAISEGDATIFATCGSLSAKCTVKVLPRPAQAVVLDKTNIELQIGESEIIMATVLPSNTTHNTVVWSSSDTNIAVVTDSGIVTGIGEGTAVITASCGDLSASCIVKVSAIQVEGITLDQSSMELTEGETGVLTATVTPQNATDKTVVWTSSNTSVATVADGVVTALKAGQTVILASCGGYVASCIVTVNEESGVRVIEIDTDADYFTLEGVNIKADRLTKGVYIRVKHGSTQKIVVK